MVWFQCEDCGDNLKKPKLPNHFRMCSASKLSCIDCGQVFGQHDVEAHTQCITEAEKYGPKGQEKAVNGTNSKPKNDAKQKPEVDINVGLSERPPWFCSLCNTKATSKQTLLLHADGKKHRAKARAYHAANQPSNNTEENKASTVSKATNKAPEINVSVESIDQNSSKVAKLDDDSGKENGVSKSNKKRKLGTSENDGVLRENGGNTGGNSASLGNGEVSQIKRTETDATKGLKKAKHGATEKDTKFDSTPDKDLAKKKIKWKKMIISALQSNPKSVLKFKKLRKLVFKSLKESGFTEEKSLVSEMLEHKINSSSRFTVDGKYVRLATSS